jgi:hypothetical protein
MDDLKYKTDQICADASLLFRQVAELDKRKRELVERLDKHRKAYRNQMRAYGLNLHDFERACRARGML